MNQYLTLLEQTLKKIKFDADSVFSYSQAYWISPDDYIIPVPERHIFLIVKNPEKFGLTSDYIKKVYKKNKESLGDEGYAREEIMADIIKKGWVRIRDADNFWIIQINKLTPEITSQIEKWAEFMIKMDKKYINKTFHIIDLNGNILIDQMDDVRFSDASSKSKKWRRFAYGAGKQSLVRQFHEMRIVNDIKHYPGIKHV